MDVRVCVRGACPFEIDKDGRDDGAVATDRAGRPSQTREVLRFLATSSRGAGSRNISLDFPTRTLLVGLLENIFFHQTRRERKEYAKTVSRERERTCLLAHSGSCQHRQCNEGSEGGRVKEEARI